MSDPRTNTDPARNVPRPASQRSATDRVEAARNAPGRPPRRWQDITTLLLGGYLMLSPLFTFGSAVFALDALVVGALIALVSVWALAVPQSRTAEWSNVGLGAGLFMAPWVLGFVTFSAAWTAWMVGLVVAVLAGSTLWRSRRGRAPRGRSGVA